MTDQQKKQKEIACSFVSAISFKSFARVEEQYDSWLLTEEGKRLTAEEPEIELKLQVQPESSYDLLMKISGQLDRIEGSMKV